MLVHITFDVGGGSPEDYPCIEEELRKLGLRKEAMGMDGTVVDLPSNTFVGEFPDAQDALALAKAAREAVKTAFVSCGVDGPVFVSVGKGWAWASQT